jgi:glucose-6-phosphate isomerase/transaldolase/glucose-6-phosphate isomerase
MNRLVDPSEQLAAPADVRAAIEATLANLRRERIVERIWQKDHTVWKPDPVEIANRLGWLTVARAMRDNLSELEDFAAEVRADGFRHVVLLGMGGSSLCPEVFRTTFRRERGSPGLIVLDSTVPAWVRRATQTIDPARSLYIVSSKSGGTVEVMSFFKRCWAQVEGKRHGKAGDHFVAITDPGTRLHALALQHGFRRAFLNPPDIGGRYSALSYFGLVPAALIGIDLATLLNPAIDMMDACQTDAAVNPAAWLGTAMGTLATSGRDKITLATSPSISSFGLWAEQLIAESSGKEGRGIVPIALEPLVAASDYPHDRLFVVLRVEGDHNAALDRHAAALKNAGHPVITLPLANRYDLGAEFFRWEMATAIAGHILGIHPFDQPNVQESKDNTQRVLDKYKSTGALEEAPVPAAAPHSNPLPDFLQQARPGDYVALMAYLDESPAIDTAIAELRAAIVERYHLATTFGYGPRFLHSTGQLHKGGANSGLFVQITAKTGRDVPIPGELFSFGVLAAAQAIGDLTSLHSHHRRAIRVDLGANPALGIRRLARSIDGGRAVARRSRAQSKR